MSAGLYDFWESESLLIYKANFIFVLSQLSLWGEVLDGENLR